MKRDIKLDWGCYQVRVEYDTQFPDVYHVTYLNGDLDGKTYRKLTWPEVSAVKEAIRMDMRAIDCLSFDGLTAFQAVAERAKDNIRRTREETWARDMFAREAMKTFLTSKNSLSLSGVAKSSFELADKMMEARAK